jgi:membrane protease YdiL (CAAX protease family)
LPVFLAYQLGVVFLRVQNASDMLTGHLLELAHGDQGLYFALTAAAGLAMVFVFAVLGRGQSLRPGKLLQIAIEGAVYAFVMSVVTSWVVGKIFAAAPPRPTDGAFAGIVMSLGAGFYEELVFRAALFGLGGQLIAWLFVRRGSTAAAKAAGAVFVVGAWAVVCAALFSGAHYLGTFGDEFEIRSFVARAVMGLALTFVYATRGFAAAVWTHALYDIWVLVL